MTPLKLTSPSPTPGCYQTVPLSSLLHHRSLGHQIAVLQPLAGDCVRQHPYKYLDLLAGVPTIIGMTVLNASAVLKDGSDLPVEQPHRRSASHARLGVREICVSETATFALLAGLQMLKGNQDAMTALLAVLAA